MEFLYLAAAGPAGPTRLPYHRHGGRRRSDAQSPYAEWHRLLPLRRRRARRVDRLQRLAAAALRHRPPLAAARRRTRPLRRTPVATAAPSSRRCSECGAGAVCSPSRSGTPTHCPWRQLRNGQPSGSAMPLAWAHSKLIKLAVTAATGRPVEMLRQVSDRYAAKVPTAAHRIADRRRCLEASLAHGGGAAPGRQVSPQLPQEERVATGLVAQDGGPPPGAVRRHASLPDEELRNVLGVQAGKVKPAYAVESVEVRDG